MVKVHLSLAGARDDPFLGTLLTKGCKRTMLILNLSEKDVLHHYSVTPVLRGLKTSRREFRPI